MTPIQLAYLSIALDMTVGRILEIWATIDRIKTMTPEEIEIAIQREHGRRDDLVARHEAIKQRRRE